MSRINTNISSVVAQSHLTKSQKDLTLHLERLSTGLKINRGADDPAGLIISERIKSDIQGLSSGMKNSDRASSVIATTESALNEVSDLLNSIKSLIVESANTGGNSEDERNANQLQIDSAIDSITRISNTASFGGLKLLNGTLDYSLSGVATSAINQATIHSASLVGQSSLQVNVKVVTSAQKAALFLNPVSATNGYLLSAMTLEVSGKQGVQTIQFPKSAPLSSVMKAINNTTAFTGVTASLINNTMASGLKLTSSDYGSDAFVSVKRVGAPPTGDSFTANLKAFANNADPTILSSPANWSAAGLTTAQQDKGQDVAALVNGSLATGRGLSVSVNTSSLGADLLLNTALATNPAATASTFYVTGGGALFQLGQDVTALQQTNFGVPSVAASRIGGLLVNGALNFLSSVKTGQGNSISQAVASGNFTTSSDILDKAIDEISTMRGRMGAFEKNVLQTNTRSLQSAFENLTASNSQIRDSDFAAETSAMTRAQILSSAGTSVLSLANQTSQQVLQLLG